MKQTPLVSLFWFALLATPVPLLADAGGGQRAYGLLIILVALLVVISALTLAGIVYLIQRPPAAPPEPPAPAPRVERLTGFDHSIREVSRQLAEIKNELGGIRNSLHAVEIQLSQEDGEVSPKDGAPETRPGTFLRLGRVGSSRTDGGDNGTPPLREAVERYCSGEIGVEALLEAARKAKRKWGSGKGIAYAQGHAAEVAVEWEQGKNAPLLVIEKDDSAPEAQTYWILVNGLRKFSEYLVVAFTEPEAPAQEALCRTRTPGEGVWAGEDRIRVAKLGEVAPC